MSIRHPELYSPDWGARSLAAKERAGWRCEQCGVAHGATGRWDSRGQWISDEADTVTVMLTVHHIVPACDGGSHETQNLVALCQRCHFVVDLPLHIRHAAGTRARRRAEQQRAAGQERLL